MICKTYLFFNVLLTEKKIIIMLVESRLSRIQNKSTSIFKDRTYIAHNVLINTIIFMYKAELLLFRYSMMQWCWKMEPDKRPSFSTLVNTLSESLEKQAGYLHVGAFTPGGNRHSSIDHNFTSSNEEITTVII